MTKENFYLCYRNTEVKNRVSSEASLNNDFKKRIRNVHFVNTFQFLEKQFWNLAQAYFTIKVYAFKEK